MQPRPLGEEFKGWVAVSEWSGPQSSRIRDLATSREWGCLCVLGIAGVKRVGQLCRRPHPVRRRSMSGGPEGASPSMQLWAMETELVAHRQVRRTSRYWTSCQHLQHERPGGRRVRDRLVADEDCHPPTAPFGPKNGGGFRPVR